MKQYLDFQQQNKEYFLDGFFQLSKANISVIFSNSYGSLKYSCFKQTSEMDSNQLQTVIKNPSNEYSLIINNIYK